MASSKSGTNVASKVFQFDRVATIVGFTVDCITIISILLALKIDSEINIYLPRFITPELAFGIWVIATYTYFAFLHAHWEKNRSEKNYEETFGKFVVKDLIWHFHRPMMLFPLLVLLIILVWIVASSQTLLIVAGVIGFILFISIFTYAAMEAGTPISNKEIDKETKIVIDKNWDYLKKRIKIELTGYQWLDINRLTDVADLLEIDVSAISYAFARYAFENPSRVKYGYVYQRSDYEKVTGIERVLVNIEELDDEEYYFGS
jgi:hypothetical protein